MKNDDPQFFDEAHNYSAEELRILADVGELSGKEPTAPQGPRRRAPHFYAGETRGRRTINYPDVVRYDNGAIPGVRNKPARRRIRAALGRAFSTIEQKIGKARSVRLEIVGLSDNGHEAHRNMKKVLALHKPIEQPASRSEQRAQTHGQREDSKRRVRAMFIEKQANELSFVRGLIASLEALR